MAALNKFRHRRIRRRWLLSGTVLVTAAVFLLVVASASGVLPGSPSKFESGNDPTLGVGNMIINTAGNSDWISVAPGPTPGYDHITDAAATNSDDSFTPGQKQDTSCPTIEGHKNPPKDDFTDVASFTEVAANGDTFLYGATIRYAANGNASENIELKQGTGVPVNCPGSNLVARVAGDKLIAIDYLGGGSAVQFHVLTWVTSGACFVGSHTAPCWGATVETLDPNEAEGGVSTSAFTAAQNPISGVPLVAGQFAEFGINLALSGIIPSGSCKSFTQTVWESRSSGSSFVSSTKDISIEDQDINNCASVSVRKVGSDGGSQAGVVFTLYEGPDTSGTVVGTCTVDSNGDCLPPFTNLQPGQYTIDETNTPPNYAKDASLPFTFTLAQGEDKALEFTDVAQLGAIKVTKTRKHAADGPGDHPHAGVSFTVGGVTQQTDANGETCFDGLAQDTYTVHEEVPLGYHVDANDQQVTVDNAATCADVPYGGETASFHNTPLTDITISVDSQVDGGTASTINCDGVTGSTGANGDGSVTRTDLEPGTYTCTVVVDP
jgi:Prealbumin-like fold domain